MAAILSLSVLNRLWSWHCSQRCVRAQAFLRFWPFARESTGHRWIPLTKVSDEELCYFLWSAPAQTVEQTIGMPVIWDAIALIMMALSYKVLKESWSMDSVYLGGNFSFVHIVYMDHSMIGLL